MFNATNAVDMVTSDAVNVAVMELSCAMNATDVEEFGAHGAMVLEEMVHVSIVLELDTIQTIGSVSFVKVLANLNVSPAMAMDMMTVTNVMEMEP